MLHPSPFQKTFQRTKFFFKSHNRSKTKNQSTFRRSYQKAPFSQNSHFEVNSGSY